MNSKQLAQYLTAGASGPNQFVERDTELAKQDRDAALRKYLQAQEPTLAGQKQAAQNKANLDTLNDPRLQDQVNNGGMAKVGDLTVGADPYAHMIGRQQSGEEGAYQKAMGDYQHGIGKIPDSIKGVQQLMAAVTSPNNRTSVGAARAAALRMLGVNRYSPDEANTTVAPNTFAKAGALFQHLGLKNDSDVLDPGLQKDLSDLGNSALDEIQQQHDSVKQNAIARYAGSSFANQAKAQSLTGTLGSPIDSQIKALKTKYAPQPPAPGTQAPASPQTNLPAQKPPGLLDRLAAAWQGRQAQAPASPQTSGKVKVRRKADGATGTMDASDPAVQSGAYEVVQ